MMFGGSLDVGHGRLAWRTMQADWLLARFSGFTYKNNVRMSTDGSALWTSSLASE